MTIEWLCAKLTETTFQYLYKLYFDVLLAFMFIFETENRVKFSSHNTGQIII